jgi:hypothetical protein
MRSSIATNTAKADSETSASNTRRTNTQPSVASELV